MKHMALALLDQHIALKEVSYFQEILKDPYAATNLLTFRYKQLNRCIIDGLRMQTKLR